MDPPAAPEADSPPRKSSAGSLIPKPEIMPKPSAFALRKSSLMSQSLHVSASSDTAPAAASPDAKTIAAKSANAASMLRNTLKRMTRLSINMKQAEPAEEKVTSPGSASSSSSSVVSVTKPTGRTGRQAEEVVFRNGLGTNRRSTSLVRLRNKDAREEPAAASASTRPSLQRSGTGSTLDRRSAVHRSQSVAGARSSTRLAKDRDLLVRKSRAVQTRLTCDALDDDRDEASTQVDFTLFMPVVLGGDVDPVETLMVEPSEPVDVRKNRALTLDNMKLQRDVERLRSQMADNDAVKKELQSVRAKLEEEQKARKGLERELDDHNEKVRMIASSMDSVEREFVNRDENIASLRQRVEAEQAKTIQMEKELRTAKDVILALHSDMERGTEQQNMLLKQFQDAETEATEMQEFLQAEKTALSETIKDNEQEMACLKAQLLAKDEEVATVEERCSHLVRIGEQRHQEVMALQAQLSGVQDRAKDMLLAQGAEITRANMQIDELFSILEKVLGEAEAAHVLSNGKMTKSLDATAPSTNGDSQESSEEPPPAESSSVQMPTAQFHVSESLQNLSRAISQREKLENGELSLSSSTSSASLPSLADRIKDVSQLVERLMQKQEEGGSSGSNTNGCGHANNFSSTDVNKEVEDARLQSHSNGHGQEEKYSNNVDELLKAKEDEITDLKAKFVRHRQILVSNYEQAESEVQRLDEICHETVGQVLKVFGSVSEVVRTTPALQALQRSLEATYGDSGLQKEISNRLRNDQIATANQSL